MRSLKTNSNFKLLLWAFLYSYIAMFIWSLTYHYSTFSKENFFKFESLLIPITLPFFSIFSVFQSPINLMYFSILGFFIFRIYSHRRINKNTKIILLTVIFVLWDLLGFYVFRTIAIAY